MFEKNLFGLEKNGDVKVWSIVVDHADVGASITVSHGKQHGKLTHKVDAVTEGKQGRDAYEQAVSQALSTIKKKTDAGYRETIAELTDLPVLAMLAKDASMDKLQKVKFKYKEGVFISDKLDGFRCLAKCIFDDTIGAKVITLESRTGQVYSVPHIEAELYEIMEVGDIIDGELYVHGPILQEISSAVQQADTQGKIDEAYLKMGNALNKYGPDHEKYAEAKAKHENALLIHAIRPTLEFRVFDVIRCSGEFAVDLDTAFLLRLKALKEYRKRFIQDVAVAKVFAVAYRTAFSMEDIIALHADAVARGFEGVMIRTLDGTYESGKRSGGLYKFKMFMDAEFKVLDVIADKQGYGIFVLQNNVNGEIFTCVMGTMEQRAHYLANKELYIGKWLKVQFQARYKGSLLPQFPTGIDFRLCDENGNPLE